MTAVSRTLTGKQNSDLSQKFISEFGPEFIKDLYSSTRCEELAILLERSDERTFERHEMIVHGSGRNDVVFEVKQGVVGIFRQKDPETHVITDINYETALLGKPFGPDTSSSAIALTPVTVRAFPLSSFLTAQKNSPELARHIINQQRANIDRSREHAFRLGGLTAIEAVADFIQSVRSRPENILRRNQIVMMALSRSEIAAYLGLTIETVSRSLSKLKKLGFIDTSHSKYIQIKDPDGLSKFVHWKN